MKNTKRVPGYSDYGVTLAGDVITYKGTPRPLKPSVASNGYKSVVLCNKDNGKTFSVHRLVALTHVKNPKPRAYNIVNHKNGNKLDNRACNLEWTNHKGNSQHAAKTITPQRRATANTDAIKVLKTIKDSVTPDQFKAIFNIMI